MRNPWTLLLLVGYLMVPVWAQPGPAGASQEACTRLLQQNKLPLELKTRGRPRRARWEQIDRVLTELSADPQGRGCGFTFSQIFRSDREEIFIPVTNNLVRVAPEETLRGIALYHQSGELVGEYSGRVSYSRKGGLYRTQSYTLYHFQFRDTQGELQSTGTHLLLDHYLARWQDLQDRLAIALNLPEP